MMTNKNLTARKIVMIEKWRGRSQNKLPLRASAMELSSFSQCGKPDA